jgi:hypothetical protein
MREWPGPETCVRILCIWDDRLLHHTVDQLGGKSANYDIRRGSRFGDSLRLGRKERDCFLDGSRRRGDGYDSCDIAAGQSLLGVRIDFEVQRNGLSLPRPGNARKRLG